MIQDFIKRGWALHLDGKYWSEFPTWDAKCMASQGWGDDVQYIQVSRDDKKPPIKTWFTYSNSPYEKEMNKGEWVFIEIRTSLKVV